MAKKKDNNKEFQVNRESKYYTLPVSLWDSYEAKCIRNNSSFEIGFILQSNKKPDKYMVYPIERFVDNKKQITYYLVHHTIKDVETIGGYSRYNMECETMHQLNLVKNTKGNPYATYTIRQQTRKIATRKIKPGKLPITRLLI